MGLISVNPIVLGLLFTVIVLFVVGILGRMSKGRILGLCGALLILCFCYPLLEGVGNEISWGKKHVGKVDGYTIKYHRNDFDDHEFLVYDAGSESKDPLNVSVTDEGTVIHIRGLDYWNSSHPTYVGRDCAGKYGFANVVEIVEDYAKTKMKKDPTELDYYLKKRDCYSLMLYKDDSSLRIWYVEKDGSIGSKSFAFTKERFEQRKAQLSAQGWEFEDGKRYSYVSDKTTYYCSGEHPAKKAQARKSFAKHHVKEQKEIVALKGQQMDIRPLILAAERMAVKRR